MKRFNMKVVDIDSRNFYYTIRRNKKYNTITQQKRNLSLKEKEDVMMLDNNTSLDSIVNVMSSDNSFEQIEKKEVIDIALKSLDERKQKMIKMRFYDDMTYDEIGQVFNITADRVRVIIQISLCRLKRKFFLILKDVA